MKKFQFRLEKVLDLRKVNEEKAQQKLVDAHKLKVAKERNLDAANTAAGVQTEQFRELLSSGTTAGDALQYHRYGMQLQRKVRESAMEVQRAEEVVTDRRRELTEASRQKKTLETLREHRREEYQLESARVEQTALDEEAGQRLYRLKEANAG